MRSRNKVLLCAIGAMLTGCGTRPIQPAAQHIQRPAAPSATAGSIPQTIRGSVVLPPPKPAGEVATYSGADTNLDRHPGIAGTVTINAINQTLPQILSRIARQVDMRYELDNGTLTVMPDSPYLRNYKIDYVNMTRDTEGALSDSTHVGSGSPGGGASGGSGSQSTLGIKNAAKNHFWETLIQNIKDILHETDKILPTGSSEVIVQQINAASSTGTGAQTVGKKSTAKSGIENSPNPVSVEEEGMTVTRRSNFREAASVIANPENGVITVRATGKQHEKIQEFIDRVMSSARRQVLIEATVVEVRLNDQYQQGINWSQLRLGGNGFQLKQAATPGLSATNTGSMFILDYANPLSRIGNLSAQVSLLESFGKVKVLSSPKLSVMNNQTAILRVVDNLVYFVVKAETTTNQTSSVTTFTTTANTVPIGFTMSVTPQINDSDTVLLNMRPSVARAGEHRFAAEFGDQGNNGSPVEDAIDRGRSRWGAMHDRQSLFCGNESKVGSGDDLF